MVPSFAIVYGKKISVFDKITNEFRGFKYRSAFALCVYKVCASVASEKRDKENKKNSQRHRSYNIVRKSQSDTRKDEKERKTNGKRVNFLSKTSVFYI